LVDLIGGGGGPDRSTDLDRHGAEFENQFKRAIEAAETGSAGSAAGGD
jgi:hypothetical protein